MTQDQILLLQLLMGKALEAALTTVRGMAPADVKAAIESEENKTDSLLKRMRDA